MMVVEIKWDIQRQRYLQQQSSNFIFILCKKTKKLHLYTKDMLCLITCLPFVTYNW